MLKTLAGLLLGCLIALPLVAAETPATAAPAAAAAPAAPATPAAAPTDEEVAKALAQFRDDLQAAETAIISRAVIFTTDEATAFWPVFKRFQTEQKQIIDAQVGAVRELAKDIDKHTDADSVAYVKSLLDRDQSIHDLRVKYLVEYSKVLPPGKAARVIQVSRRLGLASQSKLSENIPLVK